MSHKHRDAVVNGSPVNCILAGCSFCSPPQEQLTISIRMGPPTSHWLWTPITGQVWRSLRDGGGLQCWLWYSVLSPALDPFILGHDDPWLGMRQQRRADIDVAVLYNDHRTGATESSWDGCSVFQPSYTVTSCFLWSSQDFSITPWGWAPWPPALLVRACPSDQTRGKPNVLPPEWLRRTQALKTWGHERRTHTAITGFL